MIRLKTPITPKLKGNYSKNRILINKLIDSQKKMEFITKNHNDYLFFISNKIQGLEYLIE